MRFRAKLLPPGKASEPTLTKIYDVNMTPGGRVEGAEDDLVETLERDAEVLDKAAVAQLRSESFIKGVSPAKDRRTRP